MKYKLVAGDWSHDGHGQFETTIIDSNLNSTDLYNAYKKGEEIVDVKWESSFDDYNESFVSIDDIKKLNNKITDCIFINEDDEEVKDEGGLYIDVDKYFDVWLSITKLGNPEVEFKYLDDNIETIELGGYGFFY